MFIKIKPVKNMHIVTMPHHLVKVETYSSSLKVSEW